MYNELKDIEHEIETIENEVQDKGTKDYKDYLDDLYKMRALIISRVKPSMN